MSESIELVNQFIIDFSLQQTQGITSFDARVYLSRLAKTIVVRANICIVNSNSSARIHFYYDEAPAPGLPELLETADWRLAYCPHLYLKIFSARETEDFTLTIFPLKQ